MGIDFHTFDVEDKEKFDYILRDSFEFSSEYAFGTGYLWAEAYNIEMCIYDDIVFKRYGGINGWYGFPYCRGDKSKAFEYLQDYVYSIGGKLRFIDITEQSAYELDKLTQGMFTFEESRNSWDYVYKVSDLIELKGKKYHSKRNHISKFKRLYKWEYNKITQDNIDECKIVSEQWFKEKNQMESDEYRALERAINNYQSLGFVGGILEVDECPVSFTMGEKINDNVFLVHFEKSIDEYEGVYSMINNAFCNNIKGYTYVNREEDLGIYGLKKAKMSYNPAFMVKKYKAIMK